MNQLRIAKIKPNYILNEGNFPSFLGNGEQTIQTTATEYINDLFKGGITIEGSIQAYQTLAELTIYLAVNDQTTYDIVFNSGYLEITISNQKYYYFVNSVKWENEKLLNLNCHLDYWLTYWKELTWNPHGSCLIKRRLTNRFQIKKYTDGKYLTPLLALDNQIHNQDNQFNFNNHVIQSLNNLSIESVNPKTPQFVNQLTKNEINDKLFEIFGVTYGNTNHRVNLMYYAFIAPNIKSKLVFEDASIKRGNLPSGCYLVPLVTKVINQNILTVNGEAAHLNNNTYSKIANLGNNYVVSIVALPIAFHYWAFNEQTNKFNFALTTIPNGQNEIQFFNFFHRDVDVTLLGLTTNDLMDSLVGNFTFSVADVKYQHPYPNLVEPKLLSGEFTKFFLNISDKKVPLDNFNILKFLDRERTMFIQPYLTFSLAPHLYTQIIRVESNYLQNNKNNIFNTLNLAENGLFFQQDLQLISTSNAYNTFMTNHKNSYNVSLAQGKLGVQNAQYSQGSNFTKFFHGIEGGIKGLFGGGSSSSGGSGGIGGGISGFSGGWNQGNRGIQGANLGLKQIQATAQDLKREATQINDANTSETYGFLTNQNFNSITQQNGYENLNIYGYISVYQIPLNQLKIINNFYRLHGYLWETLTNITEPSFFRSRMYFDYFEITNISANLVKTNGFNLEIIDWFNAMFERGIRLWHYTKTDDGYEQPQINDYQYSNWELNLPEIKTVTFTQLHDFDNVEVNDVCGANNTLVVIGKIIGDDTQLFWNQDNNGEFNKHILEFNLTYLICNQNYIFGNDFNRDVTQGGNVYVYNGNDFTVLYDSNNVAINLVFGEFYLNNKLYLLKKNYDLEDGNTEINLIGLNGQTVEQPIILNQEFNNVLEYSENNMLVNVKGVNWFVALGNTHETVNNNVKYGDISILNINNGDLTFIQRIEDVNSENPFKKILSDQNNNIYVFNKVAIWKRIANGRMFNQIIPTITNENFITRMLIDEVGTVWVTKTRGLFTLLNRVFTQIENFINIKIDTIYEDSEHNLWVGAQTEYPLWVKYAEQAEFVNIREVTLVRFNSAYEFQKRVYFFQNTFLPSNNPKLFYADIL